MENKRKYVKCMLCAHWSEDTRHERLCEYCNNTQLAPDPAEIFCNMCGGTMCPIGSMNGQIPHGLYNAKVSGGYDSYHLLDMNTYVFSFCEECLRKLFMQCKIPPLVNNNPEEFAHDQTQYEYREWQRTGGYHQAYLDRKCNFVKDCPNRAEYTQLISDSFTENCCCEEHKQLWGYGNSRLTKFIPNVLKPFL